MNIEEFLKTIYVGDRGCKSILIDGWNSEIKLQVTCISRVRSKSWDYYTNEDLDEGLIVFEGVKSIIFEPNGVIPNDSINEIAVEPFDEHNADHLVTINVDSVEAGGDRTAVEIRIVAKSIALEDPRTPGVRITS